MEGQKSTESCWSGPRCPPHPAEKVKHNDPEKVYGSGEKVAGRVIVEVCEVTRVKAVRILACGVAKVLWMQGSQQCKQTLDYLRYEDTLLLDDQPAGK